MPDADGDTISDEHEGRATNVDTDGDGTPDYLDLDSDDDGLSDAREAGDADPRTPPVDSDGDGVFDARDGDSDGNGWGDREEGALDRDGDGREDFRDDDNDGDFLTDAEELGATPARPTDTDGDGTPDLNEIDADDDTIRDADEGRVDTDRDGLPDRLDLDSDNDTWSDREEAGDADVDTGPVDTDGDGVEDFRDPDSDGDGLSDRLERSRGAGRTTADTDGDGASDLIEIGAGTNPRDASDNPRARGNFVFVVPFMAPPEPPRDTLQFSTTLQRADVYFLMDTTGSMGGEIDNLKAGINGTLIPELRRRIPDVWMGVGRYDDYPLARFGAPEDLPFRHLADVTNNDAAVRTGVNALTLGDGFDTPESAVPALWAIITGNALTWPGGEVPGRSACPTGRFGYPCFRPDAVPVLVNFTDSPTHNGPGNAYPYGFAAPTYDATVRALGERRARVLTVYSGNPALIPDGLPHARALATATGAVNDGAPLVYSIPDTGLGLSTAVVDGIEAVSRLAIDVSVRARDVVSAGETVDAVAAFVDHLVTRTTPAPGRMCTTTYPTYDRPDLDDDAHHDTFRGVRGQPVCFDIVVRQNNTVRPTETPQVYRARIEVLGDGFTPLDEREVFFLVPPVVPAPN